MRELRKVKVKNGNNKQVHRCKFAKEYGHRIQRGEIQVH